MLDLRDYQNDCLSAIAKAREAGYKRQLVAMPTATGKTIVFAHLIKQMGVKSVVFCHTLELVHQTKEKIKMVIPGATVGVLTGEDKTDLDAQYLVATIQTACKAEVLESLKAGGYKLVVADEAHHFAANGCKRVMAGLEPDLLVGFTATPFRQDGRGLRGIFDVISFQRSTSTMVRAGWLARPVGYKISKEIDLKGIACGAGDYQIDQLDQYMNTPELNEAVVECSLEKMGDRPTICFGVSCDHAWKLSEEFKKRGKKAEFISGGTAAEERRNILSRYNCGYTQILCNAQLLTEGWDAPQTSCVIMAKPTKSRGCFTQCIGRGLRLSPGKNDCVVIDVNEKNHDICDVALLMGDRKDAKRDEAEELDIEVLDTDVESVAKDAEIPKKLSKTLKAVLVEFSLLKGRFLWKKENGIDFIEGLGCRVVLQKDEKEGVDTTFSVVTYVERKGEVTNTVESEGLSYQYAFGCAEDWARAHKKYFVLVDSEADWRETPISEGQKVALGKFGYSAGVDELTKGQAAVLMDHLVKQPRRERPEWLQKKIDDGKR